MRPPVPVVEVADDPDALGARRPHGERGACGVAERGHVRADPRAERLPQLLVPALLDQVQVEFTDRGQVAVRVVLQHLGSAGVGHGEPVVGHGLRGSVVAGQRGALGQRAGEDTRVHVVERVAAPSRQHDLDPFGQRAERPDRHTVPARMGAEHRVWIVMFTADEPVDLLPCHPCHGDTGPPHIRPPSNLCPAP